MFTTFVPFNEKYNNRSFFMLGKAMYCLHPIYYHLCDLKTVTHLIKIPPLLPKKTS